MDEFCCIVGNDLFFIGWNDQYLYVVGLMVDVFEMLGVGVFVELYVQLVEVSVDGCMYVCVVFVDVGCEDQCIYVVQCGCQVCGFIGIV